MADHERPRKRQRVNRACDACRDRKTACDGRRPVCMACESRDAADTCRYTFVPKRESEKQRRESQSINTIDNLAEHVIDNNEHERRDTNLRQHYVDPETPLDQAWSTAPSDGLATFAGNGDSSAYGPSSTIAFLRHIIACGSRPATPDGTRSKGMKGSRSALSNGSKRPELLRNDDNSQMVLPLRRNADDFLVCYWEFIHPVFPLLHQTSFMTQYASLWISDDGRIDREISPEDIEYANRQVDRSPSPSRDTCEPAHGVASVASSVSVRRRSLLSAL